VDSGPVSAARGTKVTVERISHDDLDRNLAFVAYGLLFFACFLAGAPALGAVAIAYARRHDASALARSHHAYQIWVFWIGFGLALLMGASGLAAMFVAFTVVFNVATDGSPSANFDAFFNDVMTRASDSTIIPLCLVACLVLFIVTALWLVGASAYGFIRLASGKSMGQTPG
jgi:uncharacterized membrane protein